MPRHYRNTLSELEYYLIKVQVIQPEICGGRSWYFFCWKTLTLSEKHSFV